MRPKDYYDDPIGPKDSDAPSLKVKSVNRIDIIREAIQASFLHGTQEPLIHIVLLQAPELRTLEYGSVER